MGEASIEVLATGAYHSADIGITTTHGVMFKDRYFFGGGAGYLRDFNANQYLIPIYIDGRIFSSPQATNAYTHVGLRLGGALVSRRQQRILWRAVGRSQGANRAPSWSEHRHRPTSDHKIRTPVIRQGISCQRV